MQESGPSAHRIDRPPSPETGHRPETAARRRRRHPVVGGSRHAVGGRRDAVWRRCLIVPGDGAPSAEVAPPPADGGALSGDIGLPSPETARRRRKPSRRRRTAGCRLETLPRRPWRWRAVRGSCSAVRRRRSIVWRRRLAVAGDSPPSAEVVTLSADGGMPSGDVASSSLETARRPGKLLCRLQTAEHRLETLARHRRRQPAVRGSRHAVTRP
jgi:hypothetical protein